MGNHTTVSDTQENITINGLKENIYQSALPYTADRVDLFLLDRNRAFFAKEWLNQLLNEGHLDVEVNATFQAADKLKHLFFEARNRERMEGKKVIGFGYPLVLFADKEDFIAAPLLIWQINLEPNANRVNTWTLRHNESHQIAVNQVLLEKLQTLYELDFSDVLIPATKGKNITKRLLAEVCESMAAKMGLGISGNKPTVEAIPEVENMDSLAGKGSLLWSGVLGVFPPQKVKSYAQERSLSPIDIPEETTAKAEGHPFCILNNTPQQEEALATIFQNQKTLVEGSSGTGKTHLITGLISNALSNGKKCLVVSDKVVTLKQIQQALDKQGIQQQHFLMKDALNDKSLLLEILKAIVNSKPTIKNFNQDNFNVVLNKCYRKKEQLDEHYSSVRTSTFTGLNWTDTVGLFLKNNRIEGKELLSSQLQQQDFQYTETEFEEIKAAISRSKPLYDKVNTVRQHPLQSLNAKIFTELSQKEGLVFIREQIDDFLAKTNHLQYEYINTTNDYADKLHQHYENYFNDFATKTALVRDAILDGTHRYGSDFEESGSGALKLYGIFSKKHKAMAQTRSEIAAQYLELEKSFHQNAYFDYHFPFTNGGQYLSKVKENLQEFEEALSLWRSNINSTVQEEIHRLSHKSIHSKLTDTTEDITKLEEQLEQLIVELNKAELYDKPFKNKMLTIPKRQRYLEQIIEQLETTRFYLRDYEHFYSWHRNWLGLSVNAQKVLKALMSVKPDNWPAAFESWYLNNKLQLTYQPNLPLNYEAVTNFAEVQRELQLLLKAQSIHLWEKRRVEGVNEFKKENKKSYSAIFGRNNHQASQFWSLGNVLQQGLSPITDVLPVLLATPEIVQQVMPKISGFFDYIIFEEAHQMPASEALPIMGLGQRVVAVGDSRQNLSVETDSLLDALREQKVVEVRLPALATQLLIPSRRFYQVAFAGQAVEMATLEAVSDGIMELKHVEGRFNTKDGTNEVEARHIIHLLNNIKKTPHRRYPVVGIVCFTIEQRNLIASYLLKIKQKRSIGYEIIQQLEHNGMGVYHVEELVGQHFDIMILSGTYATIDLKGTMCKNIQQINTLQGIHWLHLLTSRASRDVYILNSIPTPILDEYLDNPTDQGTYLLANFFHFAHAVQKKDGEMQTEILKEVGDTSLGEQPLEYFTTEVATDLVSYLGGARIRQKVRVLGIEVPLLIEPKFDKQPTVLIFPDGFLTDATKTSYLWEVEQIQKWKEQNYLFYPIWSVNWWRNPRQEARKLASWVIRLDGQYRKEE